MKSILFLIPLVASILKVSNMDRPKVMELDAGNEIEIPCNLPGVHLIWYWIPRYPICADIKGDQRQEIFSRISSQQFCEGKIDRFKQRSQMTSQKINGSFILTVQLHHMNDSGIFYCSNRNKNSSLLSVVVKSDDQSGMEVDVAKDSSQGNDVFTVTCKPCKVKSEAETDESSAIIWTINGRNASSQVIRKLRKKLKIKINPQSYGLWRCRHPNCPAQSDGYCLENDFGTSKKSESEETDRSTPAPPDAKKRLKTQIIIGGSVVGLLSLLGMGAVVFPNWHRCLSRRTSKTTKDPQSQGIKHSAVTEKSPRRHEKVEEEKMNEGTDRVQYSVLQFTEPEYPQDPKGEGTPAVIYAEMPASHSANT